jgi:hypothetical protein
MTDSSPYLQRSDFPNVGEERFFVVKHNPKSVAKPVTIELRQSIAEGKRIESFSKLLGIEYAIADKAEILEAAKRVEARVGRIDDVVGLY